MIIDKPLVLQSDGTLSTGLFFNDAAELSFQMPWDWSSWYNILYTLSWWLKLAAIVLKELGHPFLRFDEMMIGIIAGWNMLMDIWAVDFTFAIGVLLMQLPIYGLFWFLFDGDIGAQAPWPTDGH